MSDLKCVRVLLAAADRDIEILQLMHDSTAGPDEIFGFHAQQAAEKSNGDGQDRDPTNQNLD